VTQIRIVSGQDVRRLLDMQSAMAAVERGYVLKSEKKALLFPIVCHDFSPQFTGDMDIKSGCIQSEGVLGLKLVTWFEPNPQRGFPALYGTILLCDSLTGRPLGLVDGSSITAIRTGAAGGVGAKHLANPAAQTALMVGTGLVAKYMIASTLLAMPHIQTVYISGPRDFNHAKQFARDLPQVLREEIFSFYSRDENLMQRLERAVFIPVERLEEVVPRCQVILTATPSHTPLIRREWVQPGTHFSCIGADMKGKQEIDAALFAGGRAFVDDLTQAVEVGEAELPVLQGIIQPGDLTEIGLVINHTAAGRQSAQDITIFDSTGIALQDLLCAGAVLRAAQALNIGTCAEL